MVDQLFTIDGIYFDKNMTIACLKEEKNRRTLIFALDLLYIHSCETIGARVTHIDRSALPNNGIMTEAPCLFLSLYVVSIHGPDLCC